MNDVTCGSKLMLTGQPDWLTDWLLAGVTPTV